MSKGKKNDHKMIEFYRNRGLIPDRLYYILNGKTAQENYVSQCPKRQKPYQVKKDCQSDIKQSLEAVLADILKDWK